MLEECSRRCQQRGPTNFQFVAMCFLGVRFDKLKVVYVGFDKLKLVVNHVVVECL